MSRTRANHAPGNHPLFPKLEDGSRDIDHSTTHVQTWKRLEKLIQENPNKVKAIGVSNYSVKYLEKLLAQATIVPAVNQIENHPLLPQQEGPEHHSCCKVRNFFTSH